MENDTVVDISEYFGIARSMEHSVAMLCGGLLRCDFMAHPSVGFTIGHEIGDESIVRLKEKTSHYIHPEAIEKGMCGADEQRGTWLFEAVKSGETQLILKQYFRDELHSECRVTIIVH